MLRHKTFFLLLAVALLLGACSDSSESSPSDVGVIVGTATNSGTSSTTVAYAIGDVGPGGGIVFITPYTAGNLTELYFEAAPSVHPAQSSWCNADSTLLGASGVSIGTGESNTTTADATCTSGAIQIVSDYVNNGLSDWFLPSQGEFNEVYVNRNTIGGFLADYYWTSSEAGDNTAWYQSFDAGNNGINYKDYPSYVRPVRSFS